VKKARAPSSEHQVDLSVIVVSYNSSECLARCLHSITEHLRGAEVLVVDNASTDASVAIAGDFAPAVQIVEVGANLGFGRACNLGARRASRPQLLFLNPDVTILFARLESLAALTQTAPYGLVVPPLAADPDEQPTPQLYRYRRWLALELQHLWAPLVPREWQRPRRVVQDPAQAWAPAAMLLARRDEFLQLGGFDERYFLYAEDLDLCRRYRSRGLELRTTAALAGIHIPGRSSSVIAESPGTRAGWSLLGLLEYVARWHGEASAVHAARIMLTTFRLQIAFLSLAERAGSTRVRRKRAEIESLERFVRTRAVPSTDEPAATAECCRAARAALRKAVGPTRRRRYRVVARPASAAASGRGSRPSGREEQA
jgi:N-acetylglucosaminyl-diphospho-decaprenol L-rhamnosyltransferase